MVPVEHHAIRQRVRDALRSKATSPTDTRGCSKTREGSGPHLHPCHPLHARHWEGSSVIMRTYGLSPCHYSVSRSYHTRTSAEWDKWFLKRPKSTMRRLARQVRHGQSRYYVNGCKGKPYAGQTRLRETGHSQASKRILLEMPHRSAGVARTYERNSAVFVTDSSRLAAEASAVGTPIHRAAKREAVVEMWRPKD